MISIAIATYNGAKYLREQLDSIYAQSMLPDEIIVCDDCSTDDTITILDEYKKNYGLKFCVNNENLGFVKNFEKAISLCSGEYIALSDQDDFWFPFKIETLFNEMIAVEKEQPDSHILIHHDVFVADENLQNKHSRLINKKGNNSGLNNLLFGNPKVQGASIMMNRALKEICFPLPEGVPLHDLYLSLVTECVGIRKFISEPMALYRQHLNNQIGVNSISGFKRVRNYLKREIVIADEKELLTVLLFKREFIKRLSAKDIDTIDDYLQIAGNQISPITKITKVFKNKFNSNGSTFKLILKIANSNSNRHQ